MQKLCGLDKIGGCKMINKIVGVIFCLISAILMAARYLSAAIFMSGVCSWDAELFSAGLEYVGYPLLIGSIISLIVGIAFLGYEINQEIKNKK